MVLRERGGPGTLNHVRRSSPLRLPRHPLTHKAIPIPIPLLSYPCPQGRRILFAIGAKPAMGAVHTGDGTQWLVREYERRGIPFDAIYVWEGSGKVDVPLFWESIPEHLRREHARWGLTRSS